MTTDRTGLEKIAEGSFQMEIFGVANCKRNLDLKSFEVLGCRYLEIYWI